jgi:hypothetical protein
VHDGRFVLHGLNPDETVRVLHRGGLISDARGRLTLPALIPGVTYRICDDPTVDGPAGIWLRRDFNLDEDTALDLGDVLLERPSCRDGSGPGASPVRPTRAPVESRPGVRPLGIRRRRGPSIRVTLPSRRPLIAIDPLGRVAARAGPRPDGCQPILCRIRFDMILMYSTSKTLGH